MSFRGSAVGRLVEDSEKRNIGDNAVLIFTVATNRPGKNDDTDFFRCEMWVKPSDKRDTVLKKGTQVFITGRLEIDKYKNKEGENRQAVKIRLDNYGGVELLGRPRQATQDAPSENDAQQTAVAAATAAANADNTASFDAVPF